MGNRRSKTGFIARGTLAFIAVTGGAVAMGCALNPYTGQLFSAEPQGLTTTFSGRSDMAVPSINGFVLSNGNSDPHTGAYTNVTNTVSVYGPYNDGKDTANYYTWSFTSKPLNETEWPRGGLARFKVTGKFGGNNTPNDLYTFDNEGISCLLSPAEANKGWRSAGSDCVSPYLNGKLITAVSTVTTPSVELAGSVQYLGLGGQHAFQQSQDPLDHQLETDNYYTKINAPFTLSDFKTAYGFPAGEYRAVYYNNGDLGIGRDMHCRKTAGLNPITACYVTNYGRGNQILHQDPQFGSLDPQIAISQAISDITGGNVIGDDRIATVAMVFDPSIPVTGNRVKFMVYDDSDFLTEFAGLDNPGVGAVVDALNDNHFQSNANITVPDNCLTCHAAGGTYTRSETGASVVTGAYFLPFDLDSMIFSTQNSTYSEGNMAPQLKAMNGLVWDTITQPHAITDLLKGMYPVNGTPTGPKDPASAFDKTFVPAAWKTDRASTEVYNEVVKPYCRTCHVTAPASIDWDTYSEFQSSSSFIAGELCSSGNLLPMPQAEQTQNRFWKSPARAHFVEAFDVTGACAP